MSNLIQWLDTLARNPHANLATSVAAADVNADTRTALLQQDVAALAKAFGDDRSFACMALTPEEAALTAH